MARTLTAGETIVLANDDYSVFARVSIKDAAGNFRDYSILEGVDWQDSVSYGFDIDQFVANAEINLRLDEHELSLAPLFTTGKLATYIDCGREMKIEAAVMPLGSIPAAGDWRLVFHGETDDNDTPLDFEKGSLRISCRDLGARLQDKWIEQDGRPGAPPTLYAPTVDLDVQTVMQQILDDWAASYAITLYTPVSPSFAIRGGARRGYRPRKTSVMDALNELAGMIGWVVRYKFDSGTGTFRLTFYEPDRAKVSPDHTLSSSRVLRFGRCNRSRVGVRNYIRVTYYTDPNNVETLTTVDVTDATSVTRFGRRFMQIDEAASSAIDSATEANKLANAALADLKDVKADAEPELCNYRYNIDCEDLIRFSDATRIHPANLDVSVVAARHTITAKGARSVLSVRASAPVGSYKGWGGKGGFDPNTPIEDATLPAFTLSAATKQTGAILTVTDAPKRPALFGGIEYHLSTTPGFTPSSATLRSFTQASSVEVSELTAGTTYYAKAIVVRQRGLRSAVSNQVSFVPGVVTAAVFSGTLDDIAHGTTFRKVAGVDGSNQATAASIGTGAVTGPKILDGEITNAKVNASAGIAGSKMSSTFALPGTLTVPGQTKLESFLSTPVTPTVAEPFAAVFDEATTNFITNPNFETDTSGWSVIGTATQLREVSGGFAGDCRLKVSIPTGTGTHGVKFTELTTLDSEVWSGSVYVKVGAATKVVTLRIETIDGGVVGSTFNAPVTVGTDWVRLLNTPYGDGGALPAGTDQIRISVLNQPGVDQGAFDIYLDGVQMEKNPEQTTYCDGSLGIGYAWTGTAHASTSTRAAGMQIIRPLASNARPLWIADDGTLYAENDLYVGTPKDGLQIVRRTGFDLGMYIEAAGTGTFSAPSLALFLRPRGNSYVAVGRSGSELHIAGAGTSFPSSPSADDVFYRTDRQILYFYDGTRWLSVNEYVFTTAPYAATPSVAYTASTTFRDITPAPDAGGGTQIWIERITWCWNVGGANSGGNFWTLGIATRAGANFASFSTAGLGSLAWIRTVMEVNSLRTVASDVAYDINATESGTAGGITFLPSLVTYRLVG